jgi:hypothetical protein
MIPLAPPPAVVTGVSEWFYRLWNFAKNSPLSGTGSPAGVVAAPPGTLYLNLSGGAATTLWVKESGTGTSGWVAK